MRIDNDFKALIPPLSKEEFEQLEQNCLRDGIRDSLIVWDDNGEFVLIDGHNRYEIAQKHNLPYNHKRMTFPNREAVIEWIILNQFGRRNLSAYDRSLLALKLKPVIAERAKENQGARTDICQKSDKSIDTKKELAKVAGVSHDTIHKVEVIQEKAPEEVKEKLKSGDISINQAYSAIKSAENETHRQQQDRELREAKHRHEEFSKHANETVVSFDNAKQDQEDSQLLFEDLQSQIRLASKGIHEIGSMIERGIFEETIRDADKWDLRELYEKFQNWHSVALKAMRITGDRINEK